MGVRLECVALVSALRIPAPLTPALLTPALLTLALGLGGAGCTSEPAGSGATSARAEPRAPAKPTSSEPRAPASASAPAPPPALAISPRGSASGASSARARASASGEFGAGGLGLTGVGEGGGCPCGCDRSVEMLGELRTQRRDEALRAIEGALHTIGEREDAGYITDRMIQHRLRLVGLGKELGRPGAARSTPVTPVLASASGALGSTKVRAELIVHGEATELVNGEEKQLKACFLVRLELENPAAVPVTFARPSLESSVALPVSRWYVAGSDGEPWKGELAAGARKTLHVIGYAAEPLQPGAEVRVTLLLESLRLQAKARARKRWNDKG